MFRINGWNSYISQSCLLKKKYFMVSRDRTYDLLRVKQTFHH